jgi:hypothetical protein
MEDLKQHLLNSEPSWDYGSVNFFWGNMHPECSLHDWPQFVDKVMEELAKARSEGERAGMTQLAHAINKTVREGWMSDNPADDEAGQIIEIVNEELSRLTGGKGGE